MSINVNTSQYELNNNSNNQEINNNKEFKLISQGSESSIYLYSVNNNISNINNINNNNIKYIIKYRHIKTYRNSILDSNIRIKRTKSEKRITEYLYLKGIKVPELISGNNLNILFNNNNNNNELNNDLLFNNNDNNNNNNNELNKDPINKYGIIMKYLTDEQPKNSSLINSNFLIQSSKLIASIHNLNIIHGDLTPNNFILFNDFYYIIDFGLSFTSTKLEDKVTDLFQFIKSVLFFKCDCNIELVYESYLSNAEFNVNINSMAGIRDLFFNKLNEIKGRGRKK
ncbi:EKC/KEOPS complex subunit bud32 [Cucumispora dikerogammari]|nr:EKC/KEOPS complex subunit bud32 [Cucumispora dikerogammari]